MLSAKGEEADRIVGLESGANDYVVKPYSSRELVLRVKSILKSNNPQKVESKEILAVDKLTVNLPRH